MKPSHQPLNMYYVSHNPTPSTHGYHYPSVTVSKIKSAPVALTPEQIKQIFMQFDLDGNKVLSRDEIRKAFNYLGAVFPSFRAYRGVRYADANRDGVVDMTDELDDLVQYAYSLGYSIK